MRLLILALLVNNRKLSVSTVLTIIQLFACLLCAPTHFAVVKGLKLFDCDYNPPGFD